MMNDVDPFVGPPQRILPSGAHRNRAADWSRTMRNEWDDRFWAENHQVLSDGIDRGLRRLRYLAVRAARWFAPDESEEACKRNYCIG
jgi:hypothetical protein